jgi:hypothetical protein
MNYQRIYDSIIDRAKEDESRKLQKKQKLNYFENHHIIPKCMGGGDSKENLVLLTAKEHYMCHRLLCVIYPSNSKLAYAMFCMTWLGVNNQYRYIPSARIFESIRKEFRERVRKIHTGKVLSEETKEKIRLASKNQKRLPKTPEQIQKTIETKRKLGKLKHSENTKNKISAAKIGRKLPSFTEEHKRKIGETHKGKLYDKQNCPHCNKLVAYCSRYHFDN